VNQDGGLIIANGWMFMHFAAMAPCVHGAILGLNRSQVNLSFQGCRHEPTGAGTLVTPNPNPSPLFLRDKVSPNSSPQSSPGEQ